MNNTIYGGTTVTPIAVPKVSGFANAIKATKTGATLTLDDVSPIKHSIDCRVKTKNLIPSPKIEDFAPLIDAGLTVTDNGDGTFTINGQVDDEIFLTVFDDVVLEVGTTYYFAMNVEHQYGTGPSYGSLYYTNDDFAANDGETFVATQSKCRCEMRFGYSFPYENFTFAPQLEVGDVITEFEPFKPENVTVLVNNEGVITEYTPNADGTVTGITSTQSMTISTDTEGAVLCVEYNQDTNAVVGDIETALDSIIALQESLIGGDAE